MNEVDVGRDGMRDLKVEGAAGWQEATGVWVSGFVEMKTSGGASRGMARLEGGMEQKTEGWCGN